MVSWAFSIANVSALETDAGTARATERWAKWILGSQEGDTERSGWGRKTTRVEGGEGSTDPDPSLCGQGLGPLLPAKATERGP